MKNKRFLIIGLAFITIIIIYFIKNYNDYREKALDDVISFDIKNFESLVFNEGEEKFERRTDNKEHAEKFHEFLSQYRVKKMKDSEWNSDVSKEKGFRVTIYTKSGPIMASIYEHRLAFYNDGDYYKVINGPIDIDWVSSKGTVYVSMLDDKHIFASLFGEEKGWKLAYYLYSISLSSLSLMFSKTIWTVRKKLEI